MEKLFVFIILAIIQGITEPIPVSSSGHLVIAKSLFGLQTPDATLEILLHAGSLVAIIVYYYKDIKDLVVLGLGYFIKPTKQKQPYFLYGLKLIVATIPAGIIGLLFKDYLEASLNSPKFAGGFLLYTALLLFIASRIKPNPTNKTIGFKNALLTGLAQAVALLPGVSRSGSTNAASLIQGYDTDTSMRFAFLMFIPIALVVILGGIPDMLANPEFGSLFIPYMIAMLVSGIVTYYAIKVFRIVLIKRKLHYFAYYCIFLGLFTILFIG
ncbi:MAG: UDP pyrophosphate phosphatase [Firmicutes bacterium HGW-Firmicutes-19]|jgi:undecaprenyl-diphosphatase|nr:MAG: UDP pyrophosphate phosphatase [Firmicutes bacterium HGW-Firmicutes-19]